MMSLGIIRRREKIYENVFPACIWIIQKDRKGSGKTKIKKTFNDVHVKVKQFMSI